MASGTNIYQLYAYQGLLTKEWWKYISPRTKYVHFLYCIFKSHEDYACYRSTSLCCSPAEPLWVLLELSPKIKATFKKQFKSGLDENSLL